jgi:hypothetical protein
MRRKSKPDRVTAGGDFIDASDGGGGGGGFGPLRRKTEREYPQRFQSKISHDGREIRHRDWYRGENDMGGLSRPAKGIVGGGYAEGGGDVASWTKGRGVMAGGGGGELASQTKGRTGTEGGGVGGVARWTNGRGELD